MKIIKIDGNKLKKQREIYKLTQLELADYLNISRQQLNSLERGRSNTHENTLKMIVRFFNKPRVRGGFSVRPIREVTKAYFLI